jgi:hypothetical protein
MTAQTLKRPVNLVRLPQPEPGLTPAEIIRRGGARAPAPG